MDIQNDSLTSLLSGGSPTVLQHIHLSTKTKTRRKQKQKQKQNSIISHTKREKLSNTLLIHPTPIPIFMQGSLHRSLSIQKIYITILLGLERWKPFSVLKDLLEHSSKLQGEENMHMAPALRIC